MPSQQEEQYDVAVVGLGALGSAAAYHAAKKGAKVIAFEQFELGHVRGASHDTSRIVRTSYELPEYVALAKSSYKDWADLEADSKQKLLTITGGVVFLPKWGGTPAPDVWTNSIPNASDWAKGLNANNIPFELLDHKAANKRWPALNVPEDYEVIYTSDTGIVHAYKAITAMQFLARVNGADVRERTKVQRVIPNPTGSGVTIETSNGRFRAAKVVLAADAWINDLLNPLGLQIPVSITQEQVTYFKPSNPEMYESDKFPVWVWVGKQWYYGFPCYGEPSIKAGHDNAEQYMLPDQRTYIPSREKVDELTALLDHFTPDAGRQELRTVTCQYTRTADRQFVVSPLEGRNKDIIVTLGAAHGFKFAPAIGRVAAELALDGKTSEDISKFNFNTVGLPLKSKI